MPRSCVYSKQESCRGLVSALSKRLAGASGVSFGKEPCWGLVGILGKEPRGCLVFWSSSGLVCHHAGTSRALVPTLSMVLELSGSRVDAMLALGELPRQGSCRGCVGRPGKGLAGEAHLVASSSAPLVGALLWWSCTFASFLCPAKCGRRCGSNCPCTSKGVQRGPLLLYTDRSPRAWATYKRRALLGQAQNGARARVEEF